MRIRGERSEDKSDTRQIARYRFFCVSNNRQISGFPYEGWLKSLISV